VTERGSGPPELSDEEWNRAQRGETPTERLDRNWSDLLQELRVVQTGVQLLTGFLLTLPFQQRFALLDLFARRLYLMLVASSVLATGLLISPVLLHRVLFRRHARLQVVGGAHLLALLGTGFLAVSITGVVMLLFDIVAGRTAGYVAAAVTTAALLLLWLGLPLYLRGRRSADRSQPHFTG
jgi:hypothetical protein